MHTMQRVSILTRPESRMQPQAAIREAGDIGFQSSPGPKAGCNTQAAIREAGDIGFQSSPGPKAGCNFFALYAPLISFRFQSSPGPKAGCNEDRANSSSSLASFNPHPARKPDATPFKRWLIHRYGVSILTRPESRMQLCRDFCTNVHKKRFQSSPGPKAGCNAHGAHNP